MSDWIVAKNAIIGTSPMVLPERCIVCGRDARDGRRIEATIYWYPGWIWIGVLWGVIPAILLYYASRRPLDITYSLCEADVRSLRLRKRVAIGTWQVFGVVVIACIVTKGLYPLVVAAFALFVLACVVHMMARQRLKAAGHDGGVFGVRGLSDEFLAGPGPRSADA